MRAGIKRTGSRPWLTSRLARWFMQPFGMYLPCVVHILTLGHQWNTTGANLDCNRCGKPWAGHRWRHPCLQLWLPQRPGGVCAQVLQGLFCSVQTANTYHILFWKSMNWIECLRAGLVELEGLANEAKPSAFGRGGTGGRLESWYVILRFRVYVNEDSLCRSQSWRRHAMKCQAG